MHLATRTRLSLLYLLLQLLHLRPAEEMVSKTDSTPAWHVYPVSSNDYVVLPIGCVRCITRYSF